MLRLQEKQVTLSSGRIGVISDTHGLLRPEAVKALKNSDLIIHPGDIGKPEVIESLSSIAPVLAIRGNNVMLGYYRDAEATRKSCPDGWFRTGDLGVMHPDGYVELRDRAKDIIISGGENISSVEVEQALNSHAAVLEAAVVAGKDEKWGEVPVAFVTLKEGAAANDAELIAHVRERLAHFKAPKRVVFGPLPKTATGKVQKNALRERLRDA